MCIGKEKMVLEWRERENEDMDWEAMRDASTLQDLQRCSLLNFYCTSNMHAQVFLLETLVSYKDNELGLFDLQGETLDLTIDVIYFIMGISCRGTPMKLKGNGCSGDPLSVQDYVNTYCFLGTQVPIS